MKGNGRPGRGIETLQGRILYKRQRLTYKQCGQDRYPLDEALKRLMQVASQAKSPEEMRKISLVMGYVRDNLDWIANIPKV